MVTLEYYIDLIRNWRDEIVNDLKHVALHVKYHGYDEEFMRTFIKKWEGR